MSTLEVRDFSLLARDFRPGQLRGAQGAQGLQGNQGIPGAPGQTGANGATNVVVRWTRSTPGVPAGSIESAIANCEVGERATGGGWEVGAYPFADVRYAISAPFSLEPQNGLYRRCKPRASEAFRSTATGIRSATNPSNHGGL